MRYLLASIMAITLTIGAGAPAFSDDRHQITFHGAYLADAITLIGQEYGVRMVADGTVPHVKIPDNMPPLTFGEMLTRLESFGVAYSVSKDQSGDPLYTFSGADALSREKGQLYDRTLKYYTPDDKFTEWLQNNLPASTRVLVSIPTRRVIIVGSPEAISRAKTLLDTVDVSVVDGSDGAAIDGTKKREGFYVSRSIIVKNTKPSLIASELGFGQVGLSSGGSVFGGGTSGAGGAGSNSGSNGSVVADDRSMTLIASGSRDFVSQIEQRIATLDVRPMQGAFDVEILAVTTTAATSLGIQYGGIGSSSGSSSGSGTSSGSNSITIGSTTTSFLTRYIPLSIQINDLVSNGNARILAKTTLLASNNVKSELNAGERYPYPVIDPATGYVTFQEENVGVIVDVTPLFGQSDVGVTMHLEESDIIGSISGPNGSSYPLVSQDVYDVPGNVHLNYDDTLVLAGLMKTSVNLNVSKLQGLGDLPLIGGLFRYRNDTKQDLQIMFMFTPHKDLGA